MLTSRLATYLNLQDKLKTGVSSTSISCALIQNRPIIREICYLVKAVWPTFSSCQVSREHFSLLGLLYIMYCLLYTSWHPFQQTCTLHMFAHVDCWMFVILFWIQNYLSIYMSSFVIQSLTFTKYVPSCLGTLSATKNVFLQTILIQMSFDWIVSNK